MAAEVGAAQLGTIQREVLRHEAPHDFERDRQLAWKIAGLWPLEPRWRQLPADLYSFPYNLFGHLNECIADAREVRRTDPGHGAVLLLQANCEALAGDDAAAVRSIQLLRRFLPPPAAAKAGGKEQRP